MDLLGILPADGPPEAEPMVRAQAQREELRKQRQEHERLDIELRGVENPAGEVVFGHVLWCFMVILGDFVSISAETPLNKALDGQSGDIRRRLKHVGRLAEITRPGAPGVQVFFEGYPCGQGLKHT